jgi:hypothetical protein
MELGYDEIKTHLLAREESIRSRTPASVRQELWAIGLAYNLVRVEMERAARRSWRAPDAHQLRQRALDDLPRVDRLVHATTRPGASPLRAVGPAAGAPAF